MDGFSDDAHKVKVDFRACFWALIEATRDRAPFKSSDGGFESSRWFALPVGFCGSKRRAPDLGFARCLDILAEGS